MGTSRNVAYTASAKAVAFVASGIASITLARQLDAGDYGVAGFAMMVTGFLSRFADLGLGSAIIQRSELDQRTLETGLSLRMALGAGTFALALLAAPFSAALFDHSATPAVIRVLSVSLLLNTLLFLPQALLIRELRFRSMFWPQTAGALVQSGVATLMAVLGYRYWSIVIASIASSGVTAALLNLAYPVRARVRLDGEVARELLTFGLPLFGAGLLIFVIFNSDNFLIAALGGAAALGLYSVGFNWGSLITGILYDVVHTVMFPTYARHQHDRSSIRRAYLEVLEVVSLLAVLVNITLLVTSYEFLFLVLGHGSAKWVAAKRVLEILCVYGIVRALLEPIGPVITALGLPRVLLHATALAGVLELALLYPAFVLFKLEGVAVLVTLAYLSQYFVYLPVVRDRCGISASDLWRATRVSLLGGVLALVVCRAIFGRMSDASWILFAAKAFVASSTVVLVHGLLTGWKLARYARTAVGAALKGTTRCA